MATRRATFVWTNGKWKEAECTVPITFPSLGISEQSVSIFGVSLLRRRSKLSPDLENATQVTAWLRRYHLSQGHMSAAEMAQGLKDAGADPRLIREAARFTCSLCDAETLPRARRRGTIPILYKVFNSCVMLDYAFVWLQRPLAGRTLYRVLVAIDAFSSLLQAWVVPDGSASELIKAFDSGWCSPYGCPLKVFHDNELSLTSGEWIGWCGRRGILVCTGAAEAPWKHGRVERVIRVIRRAWKATWKSFQQWPNATPPGKDGSWVFT